MYVIKKSFVIDYCCISTIGKVRRNNEDNFYCNGEYRRNPDSVENEIYTGHVTTEMNEVFAVFDGMGGEACGEVASFIAAQHCDIFCRDKHNYDEYLYELSNILNDCIREETVARSLVLMGTTAAMIQFAKDEIYILNAGDSRIYMLSGHKLSMISEDHVAFGYSGKAPLTKFLGIPDYDASLNPYIARGSYKAGDMFLLCTDGITDMISDERIKDLISEKKSVEELAKSLVNSAVEAGGVDNATVILCRVSHSRVHR